MRFNDYPVFHLFTDASQSGWGAVLVHPGQRVSIVGARWEQATEINQGELKAVRLAMESFSAWFHDGAAIHLHIDNTSVIAALTKNHAKADNLNKELATWRIPRNVTILSVRYVASTHNPADVPSRHTEWDGHERLGGGTQRAAETDPKSSVNKRREQIVSERDRIESAC